MIRSTVIVTGATKGLGRAAALAFARGGHRVIGLYGSDEAAAKLLRAETGSLGSAFEVVRHDVSREDAGVWATLDIQRDENLVLINNAWAPFTPRPFHLLEWEDCERQLRVGLMGSWLCTRAVLQPMIRAARGTIVNVLTSALQGDTPKGLAAYVTAKHAVRGLTLALAAEYASKGIRVFSISPGFMLTALTNGWNQRWVESIRAEGPMSEPAVVAQRLCQLVENGTTPGRGEDYRV